MTITGETDFDYDDNGNRVEQTRTQGTTTPDGKSCEYDVFGRMINVNQTEIVYDINDQVIRSGNTDYIWYGDRLLYESEGKPYDNDAIIYHLGLHVEGHSSITWDSSNSISYNTIYFTDAMGNVSLTDSYIFKEDGTRIVLGQSSVDYDSYGNNSAGNTQMGYKGYAEIEGMYFLQAR